MREPYRHFTTIIWVNYVVEIIKTYSLLFIDGEFFK